MEQVSSIKTALLDVSVARLAQIGWPALTPQGIALIRNAPLPPNEKWKQDQIDVMPTIVKLARERKLELFQSMEVILEALKREPLAIHVVDLLTDVPLGLVPPAVERSCFMRMELFKYAEKEVMIQFCKILLTVNREKLVSKSSSLLLGITDFGIQNLKDVQRFKELCHGINETHYPDAFHLWTAETNGLDYFLTADKKFINLMTKTKRIDLQSIPISPQDLVNSMEI
jgi:hypothetical protein